MSENATENSYTVPCRTHGCPEPATLIGEFHDLDVTYHGVAYCDFCAGYHYRQFEILGPVPR